MLVGTPLSGQIVGFRCPGAAYVQGVEQNSLQAFYKRFSGHERTRMSDRQGADARRDATSGQFVCFCCPGVAALDRKSSADDGAAGPAANIATKRPLVTTGRPG